jgi:hypothetical protein
MSLYGNKAITYALEAWWREHGGQWNDPAWQQWMADYRDLSAVKHEEHLSEHDNGGRFGMSKTGYCTRAAGLRWLGCDAAPFSGSTRVTFFIGHALEAVAVASLRAIGIPVDGAQTPVTIDPFMLSYSDGIAEIDGEKVVLSVKTMGYKKSGQERGKWVRRGFPELPFGGVKATQPGWWSQLQAEMHGHGLKRGLVLVVAKDIIKAMEKDPYMGEGGNGSLTFYAEMIDYDERFVTQELLPIWTGVWVDVQRGEVPPPWYFVGSKGGYVPLTPCGDWKTNKEITGTFDPCSYCDVREACEASLTEAKAS